MNLLIASRHRLPAAALIVVCLTSNSQGVFGRLGAKNNNREEVGQFQKARAIESAPPAPVFDDVTRHRELSERRRRVAKAVGQKGIMILFSNEPVVYAKDVNYQYRQENNLYYLTSLKQKGATLVLTPGNPVVPEILFLPRRNPLRETWTGHMYSIDEASQRSGVQEIWDASEFEAFARAIYSRQPFQPKPENILRSSRTDPTAGLSSSFSQLFAAANLAQAQLYMMLDERRARLPAVAAAPARPNPSPLTPSNSGATPATTAGSEATPGLTRWPPVGYDVQSAADIFAELRLRKSLFEIALLQHAINITIEAMERSWAAAGEVNWEYEIDALVLYTFKLRNADHWGYPPIVGCGPNATTLHYEESQGPVKPGDLFLMDIGAEYEHYSADVTRTFPVNGKFTPAQAEIYQIVYSAQEAGAKVSRPGKSIADVDRAATEVIKDGLAKLGLITDQGPRQYRVWFMHGTSHWLGMNVHDVGSVNTMFEPGMVFTNEPGIYIRPDALDQMPLGWTPAEWEKFKTAVRPAFEKYKNIGVRIEDDMLITEHGVEWMTKALPRKLSEVEDFIARARR